MLDKLHKLSSAFNHINKVSSHSTGWGHVAPYIRKLPKQASSPATESQGSTSLVSKFVTGHISEQTL